MSSGPESLRLQPADNDVEVDLFGDVLDALIDEDDLEALLDEIENDKIVIDLKSSPKKKKRQDFFDRVDELKSFKEKHGHMNPACRGVTRSLHLFCRNTRQARRDMIAGKKGDRRVLNDDRIAALDAIGFDWRNDDLRKDGSNEVEKGTNWLKSYPVIPYSPLARALTSKDPRSNSIAVRSPSDNIATAISFESSDLNECNSVSTTDLDFLDDLDNLAHDEMLSIFKYNVGAEVDLLSLAERVESDSFTKESTIVDWDAAYKSPFHDSPQLMTASKTTRGVSKTVKKLERKENNIKKGSLKNRKRPSKTPTAAIPDNDKMHCSSLTPQVKRACIR
jgi:hypothetical protein